MRNVRTVIVQCEWGKVPLGWPRPPRIPDETLKAMFSSAAPGWGVARLWQDATFGEISFSAPELLDVGRLANLRFDGSTNPDGSVRTPDRPTTVDAALRAAKKQGFRFQAGDAVVVMISPPPSDAGAVPSTVLGRMACLLDVAGNQSFMAHEFGHVLGFDHSWGPAFGDPDAEYCDPYCVMSCNVFGYRSPWANWFPADVPEPVGMPANWTVQMGPLPAAAIVWRYTHDFGRSRFTRNLGPAEIRRGTLVKLTGYGAASDSDTVLVVADTGTAKWLIEHRDRDGWDRGIGLGPKLNPGAGQYKPTPTGVVIHRQDASKRIVFETVLRRRDVNGSVWTSPTGDLAVTLVTASATGTECDVMIGTPDMAERRAYHKVTALSTRPAQSSLYAIGLPNATDGQGNRGSQVWTKFFPDPNHPGQWSDWLALGPNVFPPDAAVTALSTGPGQTSLYVLGLSNTFDWQRQHGSQVWSRFFPDPNHSGQWTDWFALGPNVFPL